MNEDKYTIRDIIIIKNDYVLLIQNLKKGLPS